MSVHISLDNSDIFVLLPSCGKLYQCGCPNLVYPPLQLFSSKDFWRTFQLTQDCNRRSEPPFLVEQVEVVGCRMRSVSINFRGGSFYATPLPYHGVPADDAVQGAAVRLERNLCSLNS